MSRPLKKLLRAAVLAAAVIIALELLSSYALFRYYSNARKEFSPMGSALLLLIDRLRFAAQGERRRVELSIDHGHLFGADDMLGYRLLPGDYRVTETFDNWVHAFDIKINEQGQRVTAYAPVHAATRILFTGDSTIFGLGLDDEETVAWLLQTRLPNYDVVNLSVSSYSTIQALMQLQQIEPKVGKDDIVLLMYHPLTNAFNVQSAKVFEAIMNGFEMQLGDRLPMRGMSIPYGAIDDRGGLAIRRISALCENQVRGPNCARPDPGTDAAMTVTERAFDAVLALPAGRIAVLFVSGSDDDPVIRYLRSRAVSILDVRTSGHDPEDGDVIPTDSHPGPYWHHALYRRLLAALQREHLIVD